MSEEATADLVELASDIVSAYVSRNNVPPSELPALIQSVFASLSGLGQPTRTTWTPWARSCGRLKDAASVVCYFDSCAKPFQSNVIPWPGRVGANAKPSFRTSGCSM